MVPWSKITIAGKSFLSLKEENPILSKLDLDSIVKETAKAGWEIYKRKGTTYYGIAGAAVGIIKSIFHDENKVIPVSTLLEGEYGQNDIYMGVPAIIGKNGVESIIDLDLKDEEKEKFNKSALILREYISKIK